MFQLIDTCIGFKMRKASRIITKYFDRIIKNSGLKYTQVCFLDKVMNSKNLTITNLADDIGMDRTTFTRNITKLLNSGHVQLENCSAKENKYKHNVDKFVITNHGKKCFEKAIDLWEEADKKLVKSIGSCTRLRQDLQVFTDIIDDLVNS